MAYEGPTASILKDFELKPELLDTVTEHTGSRVAAIKAIVSVVAPNFILMDAPAEPGQIAQGLSEWHQELAASCAENFKELTEDPDGPMYDRQQANANADLQALQAVRRGVKAAMNNYYRYARAKSSKPSWSRTLPLIPFFEDDRD